VGSIKAAVIVNIFYVHAMMTLSGVSYAAAALLCEIHPAGAAQSHDGDE